MTLKIGNLALKNNVIPAPMAGYTDTAFRNILYEFGCELTYSEMTTSEGLIRKHKKTLDMINLSNDKSKVAIQIFGSNPTNMAEAAKICEDHGATIVDINLGCPVKKIVKGLSGSALLKDFSLVSKIIESVVKAVTIPITVKTRSGWDKKSEDPIKIAQIIEESGANAVIIHPRTRDQFFVGECKWDTIKEIKEKVSIPVIGNGEVKSVDDILRMFKETGCDGVMIGRAILGNPWLFKEYSYYINNERFEQPTIKEKINILRKHIDMLIEYSGEKNTFFRIRKYIYRYFKGEKNAKLIRMRLSKINSYEDIDELEKKYLPLDEF